MTSNGADNVAEWSPVTTEGEGDQTSSIDQSEVDTDSVDALLAELLGPDAAPSDDNGSVADGAVVPDADAALTGEPVVGSEDPTMAIPSTRSEPVAAGPTEPEPVTAETAAAETVAPAEPKPLDGEAADETAVLGGTAPPPPPAVAAPSSDKAASGQASARRAGGPILGRLVKLAVVAVLGLYLLLVGAWAVDLARHQGTVMRGVELGGTSLEGLDRAGLDEVLDQRRQELAAAPIDVVVGETTVTSDPVTLGMSFDRETMIDEAMDVGRTGFFLTRPITWLGSLFGTSEIEPVFAIDADTTTVAADTVVASLLDQPVEPEMILDGDDQFIVLDGESGVTISPRELVGRLPSVVEAGPPFQVELQAIVADPKIDQQALESVAAEINELTAEPVRVQVLDDIARVEPAMLKSWAVLDTEGAPAWSFDPTRVLSDLRPLFPTLGSEDQQARFSIVDGEPVIVPASETVVCCDEESIDRIMPGLQAPIPPSDTDDDSDSDADAEPSRTIVLEPTIVGFDEGVAELESLGIIEEVSTFTTNHACCQNRVTNIQRFADLMQGVIIRPGETFSLNDHVGRRTTEKGFVADGAINLGVLEPQVGGGISQYATTFFNASFFAGLEFLEYQSHSLYISRYPRGREATISWPRPDLEVRNNTPYGILVWNEYTSTSITVTFYSTKHLDVEALPLRRSSERQCRVDITPRVITYPDGTKTEDTVFAVYRPGEGLDCAGNSTRPDLEPAAPAAEPEPEPEPEPQPEPEPEPPADGGGNGGGGNNGGGGDGNGGDG